VEDSNKPPQRYLTVEALCQPSLDQKDGSQKNFPHVVQKDDICAIVEGKSAAVAYTRKVSTESAVAVAHQPPRPPVGRPQ
jgi:hypothetical protein